MIDKEKNRLLYGTQRNTDKISYTSEHYHKSCIFVRNRRLVDYSNYCIAYLNQDKGGTAYTVNYALQNGLEVINIAEKH